MQAAIREDSAAAVREETGAGTFGAAAVLILSAVLFFARLGARALWSSEFRWAEIAREMRLTGNYFWPTINGKVYYDKPLLSYWMVVAASHLTGAMNEAAARIPCAISGLLAVALLIILTRRLYGRRIGTLAGFILATSMSFVFFSRHASADVDTITGELAALLLFWSFRDRPDGWWVAGLWLVMAVTSLTKGLLGFVLPILVIGVYCCLADGWHRFYDGISIGTFSQRARWLISRNRWFFNWKTVPAAAIAAVVYATPFAVSQAMMGSNAGFDKVYRENLVRFFHPFDHRGPIYLYLYVIFALMAPWSALLPAALAQAHRREAGNRPADRFVTVYFWATFVFFTLSGSRRSYYLLPILPAGAMLIARMLSQRSEELSATARWLLKLGYLALAIVLAAGALLLLPTSMRPGVWQIYPPTPDRAAYAIFWIASAAAVLYAARNFTPRTVAFSMATVAYLSMVYLYIFAMPAAELYRGEKPFGELVRHELQGEMTQLVFFRTEGPLFYMDPPQPIPEYDDPSALREAIQARGIRWVITRRRDADGLGMPATIAAGEATYPWEEDRDVRNKQVLLKVGKAQAQAGM